MLLGCWQNLGWRRRA